MASAMPQQTEIRCGVVLGEAFQHPPLCLRPQDAIVRQRHVSQKVDPLAQLAQFDLRWMQFQLQAIGKESSDHWKQRDECNGVIMQQDEIIRIPDVVFAAYSFFNEMIERIQVDIGKELRRQIPDWHSMSSLSLSLSRQFFSTAE